MIYDSQGEKLVLNHTHTLVGEKMFELPHWLKKYHVYYAKLRAVTIAAGPSADIVFRTPEGRKLYFVVRLADKTLSVFFVFHHFFKYYY